MKEIPQEFFMQDTCTVAKSLLGQYLVVRADGTEHAYIITETEAYDGPDDRASHASRGKTPRTEVMFAPPGYLYVYLIYGMYWMLNVVTGEEGYPAAILIRGVYDPINNIHYDGPGKLTRDIGISGDMNGVYATTKNHIWFARGDQAIPAEEIVETPRIGVSYAGEVWANKEYRFVLQSF